MTEPQESRLSRRTPLQVQRAVLFALFVRESKGRFGGRWLGIFWVLAEPLAHLVFLMLVFGAVRRHMLPGIDFPVFLLVGIVPFFTFRNLALQLMSAVDANRGLFGYRQVKPLDTLVSRAMLEVAIYSVVSLSMLFVLGWFGFQWMPAEPLQLLAVLASVTLLGFGVGLLFAVATDELPNMRAFIRILFMPLYLLSAVMFPVSALPPELLSWVLWNPVLHAVELSRGYFLPQYHVMPQVSATYLAMCSLVAVCAGLALYRVRRHQLLAS
ncbi:ABC transporter permease [Eleftheria terrae]|uniref:ABC transporter permease n=1 Tax=Eleftheria terrae TaxID=1597781 RepID=UPI00263A4BD8|nr:ABC transporter permease [Eleftheria terrae]WKB51092.1 ABC transporter permease [Eleftheria terrae]